MRYKAVAKSFVSTSLMPWQDCSSKRENREQERETESPEFSLNSEQLDKEQPALPIHTCAADAEARGTTYA